MKNKIAILIVLATPLVTATNLMAASGAREDSSMILVYLFLGLCALIVIMQLMPAMFLVFGMVKSLFFGEKSELKVKAISKKVSN